MYCDHILSQLPTLIPPKYPHLILLSRWYPPPSVILWIQLVLTGIIGLFLCKFTSVAVMPCLEIAFHSIPPHPGYLPFFSPLFHAHFMNLEWSMIVVSHLGLSTLVSYESMGLCACCWLLLREDSLTKIKGNTMYGYNHKYLKVSLTTCSVNKTVVWGLP